MNFIFASREKSFKKSPGAFLPLIFVRSMDAESIMRYGGFALICLLMFCSVGLFFCFFIPIGGLLFAVGLLAATSNTLPSISTVCLLLTLSCVIGSVTGYAIGLSAGNFFHTRAESRFFRRSYLNAAEDFSKKHGSLAIVAGYFLPIVRTFAPVLAGIIKMNFQRFFILSILGSAAFILVFVLLGYLMGSLPILKPWLKYIIGGFVIVVTIPVVVKIIRLMKKPQ